MKLLLLLIGIAGCVAQPQQIYISDFNAIAEGVGAIGGYALSMSKLYLSDAAFAVATDAAGSPFIAATRSAAFLHVLVSNHSKLNPWDKPTVDLLHVPQHVLQLQPAHAGTAAWSATVQAYSRISQTGASAAYYKTSATVA